MLYTRLVGLRSLLVGNPLRSLKLGQNQLCGVNWKGRGEYTSVAVEALCEALLADECVRFIARTATSVRQIESAHPADSLEVVQPLSCPGAGSSSFGAGCSSPGAGSSSAHAGCARTSRASTRR